MQMRRMTAGSRNNIIQPHVLNSTEMFLLARLLTCEGKQIRQISAPEQHKEINLPAPCSRGKKPRKGTPPPNFLNCSTSLWRT